MAVTTKNDPKDLLAEIGKLQRQKKLRMRVNSKIFLIRIDPKFIPEIIAEKVYEQLNLHERSTIAKLDDVFLIYKVVQYRLQFCI
jgi:hypothetical protein